MSENIYVILATIDTVEQAGLTHLNKAVFYEKKDILRGSGCLVLKQVDRL
jgi:hypothetical protein